MLQEIRSSCAAVFRKNDILQNFTILIGKHLWWSLFLKNCRATYLQLHSKDAITGVFLWIAFVNTFFLVHFTQALSSVFLQISESLRENKTFAGVFLLDKVAHHQAFNSIKKRLQRRYFTVNFAKLLKAPCRTPPVSAYFNATFLTLRPRKTYIYVFPALLF